MRTVTNLATKKKTLKASNDVTAVRDEANARTADAEGGKSSRNLSALSGLAAPNREGETGRPKRGTGNSRLGQPGTGGVQAGAVSENRDDRTTRRQPGEGRKTDSRARPKQLAELRRHPG